MSLLGAFLEGMKSCPVILGECNKNPFTYTYYTLGPAMSWEKNVALGGRFNPSMAPRMPNGRGSLGINFDDINECSLDFHQGLQIVFFSWIFF